MRTDSPLASRRWAGARGDFFRGFADLQNHSILTAKPIGAKKPGSVNDSTHHNFLAVHRVVDNVVAVDQLPRLPMIGTSRAKIRACRLEVRPWRVPIQRKSGRLAGRLERCIRSFARDPLTPLSASESASSYS